MRVQIPENIIQLIEELKLRGDYTAISKRLTRTPENPDGDDSRQDEVGTTVRNGAGDVDVVREITRYYTEKKTAVDELKSIKAAS